jgi:hypothetical protein
MGGPRLLSSVPRDNFFASGPSRLSVSPDPQGAIRARF